MPLIFSSTVGMCTFFLLIIEKAHDSQKREEEQETRSLRETKQKIPHKAKRKYQQRG